MPCSRLRLVIALALPVGFSSLAVSGADDPPKADKPMFAAPKDWKVTRRSEKLLFYDSPPCRIGVMAPMESPGTFRDWFSLVQAPDPVVEQSEVEEGKTKGGHETLKQTRVVERRTGKLHRLYYGIRDGNRFVLILYSAPEKEAFDAHLKEVDVLADSWDFSGEFPPGESPK